MKLKELFELRKQLKEDINGNILIYNSWIEDGRFPEKHQYKGQKLNGNFDCSECGDLKSLEGAPDSVTGNFDCWKCKKLSSLEGAPDSVTGNFYCHHCTKLSSLEGIGVKYLKQINGKIDLEDCPIKSHVLGLLKVKDLKEVKMDNKEVEEIINRHLRSRNINKCRAELKDAGLEEFAQF